MSRQPALTAVQARFIRKAAKLRRKLTNKALAAKYGLSETSMGKYTRGLCKGRKS